MKTVFRLLAISLFVCLSSTARSAEMDVLDMMGKMMGAACPAMVTQMTSKLEGQEALKAKPINTQEVCGCTTNAFMADQKMKGFLKPGDPDAKQKIESTAFKSYMSVRLMSSIFNCLNQQMEVALQAAALP